jgi:hypothetical protein
MYANQHNHPPMWRKPPSLQRTARPPGLGSFEILSQSDSSGPYGYPKPLYRHKPLFPQATTTMTMGLSFHDPDFGDILRSSFNFSRSVFLQISELSPRFSSDLSAPLWFGFRNFTKIIGLLPRTSRLLTLGFLDPLPRALLAIND